MSNRIPMRCLALSAILAVTAAAATAAPTPSDNRAFRLPDHYEFDARLSAAFQPDALGRFPIKLDFDFPGGGRATLATWQLDILSPHGQTVRRWIGESVLSAGLGSHRFVWDGRDQHGRDLEAGFYTLRLSAVPSVRLASENGKSLAERAKLSFRLGAEERVEQSYDVRLGEVAIPNMPAFAGLKRGDTPRRKASASTQSIAASTLPYTIYYGNLHSQTNHSDGGAPVTSCSGSQAPQAGQYGPADAYAMMDTQAGGDFLLASEHNHMYDGSTGTNTAADPTTANNLFASGLSAAGTYNSAHPDFLALYGNEWGVISNGGHLNIMNPDGLPSWEYNASGQLIGAVATIKSDYADLYATMKARGWVGQFNHPSSSQFAIGGIGLAYDGNGAEVMVLTEVLNSSAFSTNTSETETGRSSFVGAWDTLLERGYKVAPASNQDNHCANWGLSLRNRTGVLLPTGTALNQADFLDALKARRVFATEDKTAQVVLTGNGIVMGQSLANSGALTLDANYASSSGQVAARVQFFEGVPGRNGAVTQLFEGAGSYTLTPTDGAHFYYTLVTEADGDRLWSAPLWVNQGAGGADTTAPTVSASESGGSGTITLSATASDNVGVSNVEFRVDGISIGIDSSTPYAISMDSTTLTDGSHSLTATAVDAAGNAATSAPVNFNVNNAAGDATSPTSAITGPVAGSAVSGTTLVSASASDNVGVTNVEFYLDGALQGSDATAPYEWSWNTTTASNGVHTLQSRAYDAALNVGTSSIISVSVNNGGSAGDADVSGWRISQANSTSNFTLPAGTVIPAGGYLIIARSASKAAFETYWARNFGANVVFVDSAGAMPVINGDENYSLFDASSTLIDGPTPSMPAVAARTVQRSTPCSASWVTLVESNADAGSGAGAGCTGGVKLNEFSDASGTGNYIYEFVELYNDAIAVVDTEAPSTAITAPANASTVSSTTVVTASASDNIGVTHVEFYLDGALQSTDTSTPYEWSWNTTVTANGSHTLAVKALDAAGNVGTSAAVSVTVSNDTTPPTTAITAPANGATVSGSTLVTASASDNVGVTHVEFYLDGALQSTDTSAPYELNWNTVSSSNGIHTLSSRAYDAANNSASSAISNVTVSNGSSIANYRLDQANATLSYLIPAGTSIATGGYVVIGRNASRAQFEAFWGVTLATNVMYIDSADSMPQINGSETYKLYSSSNAILDGATIAMSSSGGESLQRKNACASAKKASSWNRLAASAASPGSGAPASCGKGLYISEFSDALGTSNYLFEFVELYKDN